MRLKHYLRAKSIKSQIGRWLAIVGFGYLAYAIAVSGLGLGRVSEFYGKDQLCIFLPILCVVLILLYKTRWDGVTRGKNGEEVEPAQVSPGADAAAPETPPRPDRAAAPRTEAQAPAPAPAAIAPQLPDYDVPPPAFPTAEEPPDFDGLTPETAWEKARGMPHNYIPDMVDDRAYLSLVHYAAEGGHPEALAKLSDYAVRRGANVEAYFWASVAQKRGFAGAGVALGRIRSDWMLDGSPGEYDNVYEFFPEAYGTIGRSLLRITCSIEAPYARQRLRELAEEGNPYAALFI